MSTPPPTPQDSKRLVCGILGILCGGLGLHRFIIGDIGGGIIRIVLSIISLGALSIIGFVEGIIYLTKSDEQFISEYQVGKKGWF